MEFIGRILKYLFWLLVVSWSVALLRRLVGRMVNGATESARRSEESAGGAASESQAATRRLVRDPVCGMHVAEELAIPMREGGELLHFCSTGCRDKYAVSVERKAANA